MTHTERRLRLIEYLLGESDRYKNIQIPRDSEEQFNLYRSLVNVRMPAPISDEYLQIEDEFLKEETAQKGVTPITAISFKNDIAIWQGDITTLECDAIVNAANSKLLGCFCPCHACIDNCIHTFAGVRLRLKCNELMENQLFDETGKRVRTKKEITGEDGQIRKGCTIIKKGEVYESHLFTVKDDRFKREPFLREVKEDYTNLINLHIENPEQHLKVFDKNSVYLPTKKIGKNNPKAEEIAADNATRQEWNRTADMALVSGIEEAKILEIKQTEIHDKVSQSIKSEGWLPNLFRRIVNKAKDILQNLIREYGIPPKPTLDIDMTEFCTMRNLMIRVQDEARGIRNLQDNILPKLKTQLAETTGIFKGKERKALTEQIQQTKQEIDRRLDKLPDILREDGYPDVQAFMATYREAEAVVEQYNRDLAEWERQVKQKSRPPRPPEKESVRNRLRQLQEQGRQQKPRKKSFDRGSR